MRHRREQASRLRSCRRCTPGRTAAGALGFRRNRGTYADAHWDDTRRADCDVALYFDVKRHDLVDADAQPDDVLTLERIRTTIDPFLAGFHTSGIRVPDETSQALEELWQHTDRHHCFVAGKHYTRELNQRLVGLKPTKGGDWATFHHREGDDTYIFATVGQPGQTGHQYDNGWEGDEFHWQTKGTLAKSNPSVKAMLEPPDGGRVFVFTRTHGRSPFTFEGIGTAVRSSGSKPVSIVWRLTRETMPPGLGQPGEVDASITYIEGATRTVNVNMYERNPAARRKCIEHYGVTCVVCGFDFEATYGELGRDFIHVHHIKALAEIGQQYVVDPVADLRPVCANCHGMIHRKVPALSIEQLQSHLRSQ